MYSLNMPVSAIRTKMRQEFERHRFVAQLKTVDVLLFNSHSEFQVCMLPRETPTRHGPAISDLASGRMKQRRMDG